MVQNSFSKLGETIFSAKLCSRYEKAIAVLPASAIAIAATPATAFAEDPGAPALVTQINGFFDNLSGVGWVVYWAIIGLVAVVALLVLAKELLPALMMTGREDRPQFKGRITAAAVALLVAVALGLAPVIFSAVMDYFSASAGIGLEGLVTPGA